MTTKTYRIKPLVWEKTRYGDYQANGTGGYRVEHKDYSGWYWSYCYDEYYDEERFSCESPDDGMAAAQEHYENRLKQCLEEV